MTLYCIIAKMLFQIIGVISDHVIIPETLPPGDYVLGWRWDAEETAQVWSNCADVIISA